MSPTIVFYCIIQFLKFSISLHCVLCRDEEDFEVDVVSVSPPPKTVKSEPQSQTNVSEQTKYRFAYTDEMRTVDTITQEVNVGAKNFNRRPKACTLRLPAVTKFNVTRW